MDDQANVGLWTQIAERFSSNESLGANQYRHINIQAYKKIGLILSTAVALSACQSIGRVDNVVSQSIDEALEVGAAETAARVDDSLLLQNALIPNVDVDLLPLKSMDDARFDISVQNMKAGEFFMGLIEGTPYNMIVHDDVSGNISLQLKEVTVSETMEIVRDVYGYEYRLSNHVYQVLPATLQTEIFNINFLNASRDGRSKTRVNTGQVSERNFGEDDGVTSAQSESGDSTGSEVETITQTNLWQELTDSVNAIIGNNPEFHVTPSPQSGTLIVRARPSELRAVRSYIKGVESSLNRQVILEAKIIEVVLDDGFESGIEWEALGRKTLSFAMTGPELAAKQAADADNIGGLFSILIDSTDFSATIEWLETQGSVNMLSSPRVSTLNNQKALIKVGSDEFFVTDISVTSTVGGNNALGNVTPDLTLTPFFSGIALDVTPQISAEGLITLHVHPSVSEVQDQEKVVTLGSGEDGEFRLPLAFSTIRESDSIIKMQSGQVVVIGGLMQDQARENEAGLPGLRSLPFVGHLFNQAVDSTLKSELVIMLKATLVNDAVWNQAIKDTQSRIASFKKQYGLRQ